MSEELQDAKAKVDVLASLANGGAVNTDRGRRAVVQLGDQIKRGLARPGVAKLVEALEALAEEWENTRDNIMTHVAEGSEIPGEARCYDECASRLRFLVSSSGRLAEEVKP